MSEIPLDSDLPRRRYRQIFALLLLLHLGLCVYAFPSFVVFGGLPYGLPDYQTHYQQTSTLTKVVKKYGKLWAYDPNLLAGTPVGLIFDVDNKAHFLFSYGLHRLGVPLPIAFNLFTVLTALLAPLSIWIAARLFRLGARAELFALGLGTLLWHFDSTSRHCWAGGMVSFATVSHGSMVVLGLFYRLIEAARLRRAPREPELSEKQRATATQRAWPFLVGMLVCLPLLLLVHVWAFGVLVVPLVGIYLRSLRRIDRRGHLEVWGIAAFALVANLFWLWPALVHIDLLAPSGKVGQATPAYLLWDFFELWINPITTGFIFPHTLWRYVALFAAVATLWRWRATRDSRLFVAALALGWLYGLTYFASLFPGLRETEPYRFIIPSVLAAGLFAAPWLAESFRREHFTGLPRQVRGLFIIVGLLLIPRVMNDVFHFMPEVRPSKARPAIRTPKHKKPQNKPPVLPIAEKPPMLEPKTFRMLPLFPHHLALAGEVEKLKEPGRILVQKWNLGETLRWATTKPIIGGFPDRRLIHEQAYIFRDTPEDPRYWGKDLADYFVRYNIRYFIASDRGYEVIESRRDLLEPLKMVAAHRIYRVRHLANYFRSGSGRVQAKLNRIEVRDAQPAPGTQHIELKFHYMRTLRCRPDCRISRIPIPHDEVGFIRIEGNPSLPKSFVIEHVY